MNFDNMCYANALFQAILFDLIKPICYDTMNDQLHLRKVCSCIGCILLKTCKTYLSTFVNIPTVFKGLLSVEIVCNMCYAVESHNEEFSELILEPSNSISESLHKYFEPNVIIDYKCFRCGFQQISTQHYKLLALPKILCIVLNRFKLENIKNQHYMDIDLALNMCKFLYQNQELNSSTYELKSFICHTGNLCDSGHYYTIKVRLPNYNTKFDDHTVTHTNDISDTYNQVYLLFYELTVNETRYISHFNKQILMN